MNIIRINCQCPPEASREQIEHMLLDGTNLNGHHEWQEVFRTIPDHIKPTCELLIRTLLKYKTFQVSQIAMAAKLGKTRATINIHIQYLVKIGILCLKKGPWKVSNTYHLHSDLYSRSIHMALSSFFPVFGITSLLDLTLLKIRSSKGRLTFLLNKYKRPKEAFAAVGISESLVKTQIFFGLEFQDMLRLAAFPLEALEWAYEKFAHNSRLAKWKTPKEKRKAFYFRRKTLIKKPLNWLLAMCFVYCQWNNFVPNWNTYYQLVDVQDSLVAMHAYFSRSYAARSPKMFRKTTDSRVTDPYPYKPFVPVKVQKEDPVIHNNKLLEHYNNNLEWHKDLAALGITIDQLLKPSG